MEKSKPYGVLPQIYSHLMRKIRYDNWAKYIYEVIKDDLPKNPEILELAGGNGEFLKYFSKFYKNIILTDISLDMLKCSDKSVPVVCCNMVSLPFKKTFDLIYANFDSINYLLTIEELKLFFKEISLRLKNNGVLTFDISLENNSYRHVKENKKIQRTKDYIYDHHSVYNPRTRIHTNKFIIKFSNGITYTESHKQKIYPFEKYFDVIIGTGLYVSDCLETFTFDEANSE